MKNYYILVLLFLTSTTVFSQVGIGNTDPQATLDISAKAIPDNTDGILIPRLDDFPTPTPTTAQDGMMIFATGAGTPTKGFYYWDSTGPGAWVAVSGGGATLDQSYDFGGAGIGRIITADNGAVEIQGAGGLRVEDDITAAESIVHDGDTNTFMEFTPDRVQFDAGGRNYIDIQHSSQEIAFNEESTQSDFRVESGNNEHMIFVDGSADALGINNNAPSATLDVVGTMQFEDGNEAAGFVLTSDANGNASWTDPSLAIKDPKYPDGFQGMTPILLSGAGLTYTVPANRTFYITSIYTNSQAHVLTIDGMNIQHAGSNNAFFTPVTNPIIASAGQVVARSASAQIVNGFLVDEGVTPITQSILSSASYTVPAGQILIILSAQKFEATGNDSFYIRADGEIVYFGTGNTRITGSTHSNSFFNPIFLPEGTVLTSSAMSQDYNINGYLIDN